MNKDKKEYMMDNFYLLYTGDRYLA